MNNKKTPFLIAITGSIASGKSTASKWFEDKGYEVYYADKIGHEILKKSEIVSDVINEFGSEILKYGKIDRRKLGEIVFDNPEKLKFLNNLLHPRIRVEMQKTIDTSNSEILFFEIPLLFENGLEKGFDLIINVSTKKENQITRLKKRDGISKKKAQKKIDTQIPDEEKQKRANVNIFNNNDVKDLHSQLEKFQESWNNFSYKKVTRLIDI